MASNMAPEGWIMMRITKPQGTGNDRPSISESKLCHNLPGCSKFSTTIAMSPIKPVNGVAELLATRDDRHTGGDVRSHGRIGCRISQTWQPKFLQCMWKFSLFQSLQGT